jgi:alkylated DNA repair dioxygenase AlkB
MGAKAAVRHRESAVQADLFEPAASAPAAEGAAGTAPHAPAGAGAGGFSVPGTPSSGAEPGRAAPQRAPALPPGWVYRTDFIDAAEEAALLARIAATPLHAALYKGYTAKRRIANFGTAYDYDDNRLLPGPPLPDWLLPLRARCATWLGVEPEQLSSGLLAEYAPGTPLGWHRDVPDFEAVVGVSLASAARMRFRRYPPVRPKKADVVALELAPRSAYQLRGTARWGWQHSVAPTPELRFSITFRTRVAGPRADRRGAADADPDAGRG